MPKKRYFYSTIADLSQNRNYQSGHIHNIFCVPCDLRVADGVCGGDKSSHTTKVQSHATIASYGNVRWDRRSSIFLQISVTTFFVVSANYSRNFIRTIAVSCSDRLDTFYNFSFCCVFDEWKRQWREKFLICQQDWWLIFAGERCHWSRLA